MITISVSGDNATDLTAQLQHALDALGGGSSTAADKPAPKTADKPAGKPAGKPAAKEAPTTEERSGGIPYEDVSAKVLEVSKTKGRDAATNLLAEFQTAAGDNCTKGKEIEPEDYAAFMERAAELLAEDLG